MSLLDERMDNPFRVNILFQETGKRGTLFRDADLSLQDHQNREKESFYRYYNKLDRVFHGPDTTLRNVIRAFDALNVNYDLNSSEFDHYDANLILFWPVSKWRSAWFKRVFLETDTNTGNFFLHPLAEIRWIYDKLIESNSPPEMLSSFRKQCLGAHYFAETPKQFFRIKNDKRKLCKKVYLAPTGYAHDLRFDKPWHQRSDVVLLIKDNTTSYNVMERSQHLRDMLNEYKISFRLIETHRGRPFIYADYLRQLLRTRYMVVWTPEETHGHCMHEAKALDVPIFTTTSNGMNYFNDQCGMIASENDLYPTFEAFLKKINKRKFKPSRAMKSMGLDAITTSRNFIAIMAGAQSRYVVPGPNESRDREKTFFRRAVLRFFHH